MFLATGEHFTISESNELMEEEEESKAYEEKHHTTISKKRNKIQPRTHSLVPQTVLQEFKRGEVSTTFMFSQPSRPP